MLTTAVTDPSPLRVSVAFTTLRAVKAMGKSLTFEMPPVELATERKATSSLGEIPAGVVAFSSEEETKVVVSGLPFQKTVSPEAKPAPLTISVTLGPPASTEVGERAEIARTGRPALSWKSVPRLA